jgi:glucosylceramidase
MPDPSFMPRFQLSSLAFVFALSSLAGTARADEPAANATPLLNVTRYITARDTTMRMKDVPITEKLSDTKAQDLAGIRLDTRVKYQTIQGFGGAFTDSAGYVLKHLPEAKQEEVMRAYFDPEKGLGYTVCRTHINSCDFSLGNYAYDETSGDTDLKNFSIERDKDSLIPMIKRAQDISHNGFKLFASPWSPPAWMKTNGEMNHGGKLKPEDRDAWARYYVKYIQAYAQENIPIWAVTVQNEPAATQSWDSCIYTGDEERDFVRDYLGPTFAKAGMDTKIIIWDHNRDIMFERAGDVLNDPAAAKYVWGVGFHWYVSELSDNVQRTHDAWPDKHLLATEGCQEGGPHPGEWLPAERYGRNILMDLNHWSEGWVDWNMLLDERGGPNHVGNFTSAPILANLKTGEISFQPSFYYIGQFAKFVHPNAVRVLAAPTNIHLETTAFVNPDGSIVTIVMNETGDPIRFELRIGAQTAQMDAPSHSIQTVVVKP